MALHRLATAVLQSMSSIATPARHCLELATAAAPALLGRVIDVAVADMQAAEVKLTGQQRQEMADSWLLLLQHRRAFSEQYPSRLRSAFEAPPEATPAPAAANGGSRKPPLSLVDDESVVKAIESSRLTQLLAPRLEQPLAELDALMSSALGLPTVTPERNPLRPAVFAQALRNLMQADAPPFAMALWTRHVAPPLAAEIETLYREALRLLGDSKLQAASYRVLPTNSGHAPLAPASGHAPLASNSGHAPLASNSGHAPLHAQGGPAGAFSGGSAPGLHIPSMNDPQHSGPGGSALGGAAWADLSRHGLGDELFQHFLFARTPPSTQALAPSYYAQVDQQLAALEHEQPVAYDPAPAQQHRALEPVERPHRAVDTATALDDAVWGRWGQARERSLVRTQLKKEARQVGQVLGLEVVRKLVDQVGRDPRLLAPVRESIVALEPALLRLALKAPRFFSQEEHAGRRLVERVAERSFRFNDEFSSEFQAFFTEVRPIFQALNEAPIEDDAPFQRALDHLEENWKDQDGAEERGRQVAVDAMHFAEAREAEAGQIAWTLSKRSDMEDVPAVVQDFVFGPWALVIAHARLKEPRAVDPGGGGALVADLLWSVKRKETLRDPARLIALVPSLLQRLFAGLALLGQGRQEHETFFLALEKLHRPVLKLTAKHRQSSQPADLEVDAALLSTERQQPRGRGEELWLAPKELEAAGFDDTPNSSAAPLLPEGEVASLVDHLHLGSWVDLYSRQRWRRAHLTWVSNRQTLFMFVSHGGRPHSMTRRSLEKLVRDRLLRTVEAGAVVDRALEQVAAQAHAQAPARNSEPQALAA